MFPLSALWPEPSSNTNRRKVVRYRGEEGETSAFLPACRKTSLLVKKKGTWKRMLLSRYPVRSVLRTVDTSLALLNSNEK